MESIVISHALVDWEDESTTVVKFSCIEEPRKPYEEYQPGDEILSKCPPFPGNYRGSIVEIGEKKELEKNILGKSVQLKKSENKTSQPSGSAMRLPESASHSLNGEGASKKRKNTCTGEKRAEKTEPKKKVPKKKTQDGNDDASLRTKAVQEEALMLLQKVRDQSCSQSNVTVPIRRSPRKLATPTKQQQTPPRQSFTALSSSDSEEEMPPRRESQKQVSPDKGKRDRSTGVSESEDEMFSRIQQNLKKLERSYGEKVSKLEERVEKLEREVRRLKRASRKPETATEAAEKTDLKEVFFNGHKSSEIECMVKHNTNFQNCVKETFLTVFGDEYIVGHSIQGRKANVFSSVKPPFDKKTLSFMISVLKNHFPEKTDADIKSKIQNLQKALRLKNKNRTSAQG